MTSLPGFTVQIDQNPDQGVHAAIDHRAAQRLELSTPPNHLSGNEFHDLERRTQHRDVVAEGDRARHRNRGVM